MRGGSSGDRVLGVSRGVKCSGAGYGVSGQTPGRGRRVSGLSGASESASGIKTV